MSLHPVNGEINDKKQQTAANQDSWPGLPIARVSIFTVIARYIIDNRRYFRFFTGSGLLDGAFGFYGFICGLCTHTPIAPYP